MHFIINQEAQSVRDGIMGHSVAMPESENQALTGEMQSRNILNEFLFKT